MNYFSAFFVALLLSLALVPAVRRFATHRGLVNNPTHERWDSRPVALLGGVAIVTSYTLATLLVLEPAEEWMVWCAGGLVIFGLGLFDDLFGVPAAVKIVVQSAVAFALTRFDIVSHVTPSGWLDVPLTVVWIVGLSNAFNLLDNMDGLAGGTAIAAASGLFGVSVLHGQTGLASMCLALVGACAGFLKSNFKPAAIYMGDCGSLFLGYTLAVLAIMTSWHHGPALAPKLFAPFLILGVALFDTTLVSILRLANHRRPWCGGRDHSSHRLVPVFRNSEKRAVMTLYGIGVLSSGLGIVLTIVAPLPGILMIVIFCAGMITFGAWLARISGVPDTGDRERKTSQRPIREGGTRTQ